MLQVIIRFFIVHRSFERFFFFGAEQPVSLFRFQRTAHITGYIYSSSPFSAEIGLAYSAGPWPQRDLVLGTLAGGGELPSSLKFRLTFSTMPVLGEIFERDLELSIVGGIEGNAGKSSSSRPGGFGCSGAKVFLKESEGVGLYEASKTGSGGIDGTGASLDDGVRTTGDASKDGDVGVGILGIADAAAVAAATAASSSSAFRIRSRSLSVLNVLLLSLGTSGIAFSD